VIRTSFVAITTRTGFALSYASGGEFSPPWTRHLFPAIQSLAVLSRIILRGASPFPGHAFRGRCSGHSSGGAISAGQEGDRREAESSQHTWQGSVHTKYESSAHFGLV
jgi:hypothetical protein